MTMYSASCDDAHTARRYEMVYGSVLPSFQWTEFSKQHFFKSNFN